jgi:hypothetical protein
MMSRRCLSSRACCAADAIDLCIRRRPLCGPKVRRSGEYRPANPERNMNCWKLFTGPLSTNASQARLTDQIDPI